MVTGHHNIRDEALAMSDGAGHVVECSCGEGFQEGPTPGLTAHEAKTAVYSAVGVHRFNDS